MAIKTALIKTEPRCLAYDCEGFSLGREGRESRKSREGGKGREGRGPDSRQCVKLAGRPWRHSCKVPVPSSVLCQQISSARGLVFVYHGAGHSGFLGMFAGLLLHALMVGGGWHGLAIKQDVMKTTREATQC